MHPELEFPNFSLLLSTLHLPACFAVLHHYECPNSGTPVTLKPSRS